MDNAPKPSERSSEAPKAGAIALLALLFSLSGCALPAPHADSQQVFDCIASDQNRDC